MTPDGRQGIIIIIIVHIVLHCVTVCSHAVVCCPQRRRVPLLYYNNAGLKAKGRI